MCRIHGGRTESLKGHSKPNASKTKMLGGTLRLREKVLERISPKICWWQAEPSDWLPNAGSPAERDKLLAPIDNQALQHQQDDVDHSCNQMCEQSRAGSGLKVEVAALNLVGRGPMKRGDSLRTKAGLCNLPHQSHPFLLPFISKPKSSSRPFCDR